MKNIKIIFLYFQIQLIYIFFELINLMNKNYLSHKQVTLCLTRVTTLIIITIFFLNRLLLQMKSYCFGIKKRVANDLLYPEKNSLCFFYKDINGILIL